MRAAVKTDLISGQPRRQSRRETSRAAAYSRTHTASAAKKRLYPGGQETIDILHPPGSEPGVKLSK
jgi:hypothetical protein